jgi:hypothetical protein
VGAVSSRFYRWRRAGIWGRVPAALQAEADARGEVDRGLHFVDATIARAYRHAAGAPDRRPPGGEAMGRSRGGLSSKIHPRAEGTAGWSR